MALVVVSPRKELQRVLKALPALQVSVGDRIYIGKYPDRIKRMQQPYIELHNVGDVYQTDYYNYVRQRIDLYTVTNDEEQADEIDLLIFSHLNKMHGGLPLVEIMPSGSYGLDERSSSSNVTRRGLFRPYRVLYLSEYDDGT